MSRRVGSASAENTLDSASTDTGCLLESGRSSFDCWYSTNRLMSTLRPIHDELSTAKLNTRRVGRVPAPARAAERLVDSHCSRPTALVTWSFPVTVPPRDGYRCERHRPMPPPGQGAPGDHAPIAVGPAASTAGRGLCARRPGSHLDVRGVRRRPLDAGRPRRRVRRRGRRAGVGGPRRGRRPRSRRGRPRRGRASSSSRATARWWPRRRPTVRVATRSPRSCRAPTPSWRPCPTGPNPVRPCRQTDGQVTNAFAREGALVRTAALDVGSSPTTEANVGIVERSAGGPPAAGAEPEQAATAPTQPDEPASASAPTEATTTTEPPATTSAPDTELDDRRQHGTDGDHDRTTQPADPDEPATLDARDDRPDRVARRRPMRRARRPPPRRARRSETATSSTSTSTTGTHDVDFRSPDRYVHDRPRPPTTPESTTTTTIPRPTARRQQPTTAGAGAAATAVSRLLGAAAVPPATGNNAVITVKVGGDRSGTTGVTGLAGVVLQLYDGGSGGPTTPVADTVGHLHLRRGRRLLLHRAEHA